MQIESFYTEENPIRTFDNLNLILHLNFLEKFIINSICILFYNELNERIAIIDLRESILTNNLKLSDAIKMIIKIQQLNLVDGEYNIGLYVDTDLFVADFFDLWKLVVDNKIENVISYDKRARGCLEIKYEVEMAQVLT